MDVYWMAQRNSYRLGIPLGLTILLSFAPRPSPAIAESPHVSTETVAKPKKLSSVNCACYPGFWTPLFYLTCVNVFSDGATSFFFKDTVFEKADSCWDSAEDQMEEFPRMVDAFSKRGEISTREITNVACTCVQRGPLDLLRLNCHALLSDGSETELFSLAFGYKPGEDGYGKRNRCEQMARETKDRLHPGGT